MIRIIVALAIAAGLVLIAGYLLLQLVTAIVGRGAQAQRRTPAEQARRIGYSYIFACWLICSAVLTALIWEYWFV